MGLATGLGASWGFAEETTVGTIVTPNRFFEFTGETFAHTNHEMQGLGLRAVGQYARASRRTVPTVTAGGDVTGEFPTNGAGLLIKHMLGGTPIVAQQGVTTAYQQVHVPGSMTGMGLTVQKGVPTTSGGVQAFTYRGSKVTGWEIACATGAIATLKVNFDSFDETTATGYATPSYTAGANVFTFAQGAIYQGGTVATAAGVATRTGGTLLASVKSANIVGANPLKVDRYFLGANGVKGEQLENGWRTVTGSLVAEFADTSLYTLFRNNTQSVVELVFTGAQIGTSGFNQTMAVLLPAAFFTTGSPVVGGPDVIDQTLNFAALDDGTNAPIQIRLMSSDTAP